MRRRWWRGRGARSQWPGVLGATGMRGAPCHRRQIDWYCCPSFDAPSVFGSLLDADQGGSFELAAAVPAQTRQFYLPDTNVLITRFFAEDGVGEIQDFMPVGDAAETRHRLIRRVVCVRGAMPFRARVWPRFGYGRNPHIPHRGGGRGGGFTAAWLDRWPEQRRCRSGTTAGT